MRRLILTALTCLTALPAAKSTAPLDCAALPAPVRNAAAPHIKTSTKPPACERIAEDGAQFFEVKVIDASGRMREFVYRPDGVLHESEEEIPAAEAPASARQAIDKAVGSGTLRKIDRIQRGKQTLYEGEYLANGQKRKIIVDPSGNRQR
jgi:hypothetical protein